MKKLAVILLALSLVRVGVAYADTTTAQSDTFAAGQTSIVTDANQVLYFYKGADGQDGQDGADGQDGQDGLNGVDGANGVNVATTSFTGERGGCTNGGVQVNAVDNVTYICNGSSGTGVISVLFTGSRGTCTNGGVQLTDSTGAVTYACNGRNGTDGSNGSITSTTSGTPTPGLSLGDGQVATEACDPDGVVKVSVSRDFDGADFKFSSFSFGAPTGNGRLDVLCASKPISVFLKIDSATALNINRVYQPKDLIECKGTTPASNSANWTDVVQYVLDAPASCFVRTRDTSVAASYLAANNGVAGAIGNANRFDISEISTRHYIGNIGFTIG